SDVDLGGGTAVPPPSLRDDYLLLLPDGGVVDDGDDDELLELDPAGGVVVLEPLLELDPEVVSVERDGEPGDADGVRSVPGRSPTRSLRDSLQPAIIVAPRTRAKTALSNFFIWGDPSCLMAPFAVPCDCNASATHSVPWYTRAPFISRARHRRSNR